MKPILIVCAASLLAACQSDIPSILTPTTTTPTTTSTQGSGGSSGTSTGTSGGTSTSNVVLPNYATNGFTLNNQGIRNVMVTETDTSGVPQNMSSGAPTALNVLFNPSSREMRVTSTKRAFDGTLDTESVTYRNGGRASGRTYAFNDSDGRGNGVNQAYLQIGEYAYSGHANLDQDDGRFRHAVSFANGQATSVMPRTGTATYTGNLDGTAEYTVSTAAQDRGGFVALSGQSTTEVNFGSGTVASSNVLTNGATGSTIGVLNNTSRISGNGYSSSGGTGFIIVDGTRMSISNAGITGAFAGPNAQETSGTFSASSRVNGATANRLVQLNGAFLGADQSR